MNNLRPEMVEKMRRAEVFGIGPLIVKHRCQFPESKHLLIATVAEKLETAIWEGLSGLATALQCDLDAADVGWRYDEPMRRLLWWYPSGDAPAQDATIDYFAITRDVSS